MDSELALWILGGLMLVWIVIGVFFTVDMFRNRKEPPTDYAKAHPVIAAIAAIIAAICMTLFWIVILLIRDARDPGN